MSAPFRAIETRHNGYRFRSRLEARWSVCFDALGIRWRYEQEGYALPDGRRYLPDFWLLDLQCYFEVKGAAPTSAEERAADLLSRCTGYPVYIAWGGIGHFEFDADWELTRGIDAWTGTGVPDIMLTWGQCRDCGAAGIATLGEGRELLADSWACGCIDADGDSNGPAILAAFDRAKSARFEFGESG